MIRIKAFSDLEQSKKLAEILPIESADMFCADVFNKEKETHSYNFHILSTWGCNTFEELKDRENKFVSFTPVWSLAALLNLLPNEISTGERYCDKYQIDIRKYDGGDNTTLYQIAYGNNRGFSGSWHDMINTSEKKSAIDACYELILKLNELNLL